MKWTIRSRILNLNCKYINLCHFSCCICHQEFDIYTFLGAGKGKFPRRTPSIPHDKEAACAFNSSGGFGSYS